jgi:hypothetical protein
VAFSYERGTPVQGYLARKEANPPRTLLVGPYGAPKGGGLFLESEVPLYLTHRTATRPGPLQEAYTAVWLSYG